MNSNIGYDTDKKMVSVEDVLETIRDMAHHPGHLFKAQELIDDLEWRLMRHEELGPKLMGVTDLEALPVGSVVWEEFYNGEEQESTRLEPAMKTDSGILLCESGYTIIMEGMGDPDIDRNRWRWWSARPTDKQRTGVKWE